MLLIAANSKHACRVQGCRLRVPHELEHEQCEQPYQCMHGCPRVYYPTVAKLRQHLREAHDERVRQRGALNFVELIISA